MPVEVKIPVWPVGFEDLLLNWYYTVKAFGGNHNGAEWIALLWYWKDNCLGMFGC